MKSLAICALLGEISAIKIPVVIDVPENQLDLFQANPMEYIRPHNFMESNMMNFPNFNIEFPKVSEDP